MTTVKLDKAALAVLLESEQGDVGRDLQKRAIRVEAAAKRIAPVDSGRYRGSITHDLSRDAQGLFARVGSNVHYAIYLEFGTRFMRAFATLRTALRAAK